MWNTPFLLHKFPTHGTNLATRCYPAFLIFVLFFYFLCRFCRLMSWVSHLSFFMISSFSLLYFSIFLCSMMSFLLLVKICILLSSCCFNVALCILMYSYSFLCINDFVHVLHLFLFYALFLMKTDIKHAIIWRFIAVTSG